MADYVLVALVAGLVGMNVVKIADARANMLGVIVIMMTFAIAGSHGGDIYRKARHVAEDAQAGLAATEAQLNAVASRQVQPPAPAVKALLLTGDPATAPDAILHEYDNPRPFTEVERKAKVVAIVKASAARQAELRATHKSLQAEYAKYLKNSWVMKALVRWCGEPAAIPDIA